MPLQKVKSRSEPREKISPPTGLSRGPSLFFFLYAAITTQGLLAIYTICLPQRNDFRMQIMLGLLAVCGLLIMLLRYFVQDWYSALEPSGRVMVYVFTGLFFLAPSLMPGHHLLPEGFAYILYPLLLLAIDQSTVRLYLACTLLGFWFGLYRNPGADLQLVLAFGFTTLCSFASMHFAFTGEPFNLRGWWATRRIVQTAILYFAPAALAAYLAYQFWPEPPPGALQRSMGAKEEELLLKRAREFTPEEWNGFVTQLLIAIGLVIASLIALHYLRKFLNRRTRPANLPQIFGADVSELEYFKADPVGRKPSLPGTRGEIVKLWKKWAREKEAQGIVRLPTETASELGGRVVSASENKTTPPQLTGIFERAHYDSDEPTRDEVELMKRLVREDAGVPAPDQ